MSNVILNYPPLNKDHDKYSVHLLGLREAAIGITDGNTTDTSNENLYSIYTYLKYASSLMEIIHQEPVLLKLLSTDLTVTLINCSTRYSTITTELLQRAYASNDTKSKLWVSAGQEVKKGLGLLQFLQKTLNSKSVGSIHGTTITEQIKRLQLLSQLTVITLSLLKLKHTLSNPMTTKLELETNKISTTASACVFNTKLCIGCLNNAGVLKHQGFINQQLLSFLDGSAFLLMSIDEFKSDETGVSIGMLEQTIKSYSDIIPRSDITQTILSKNDSARSAKETLLKKKDLLKNKMHHTLSKTKNITSKVDSKVSTPKLLPVLDTVLHDFLIPLIQLLRYVYKQTNEKLTFKPVESDINTLKAKLPSGISPNVIGIEWTFENGTLQTIEQSKETSNTSYF